MSKSLPRFSDGHKNAHGDCDAAIAKAAAVVTHVQSLSQEVGSGDEGLGLLGFDLLAETGFWLLGEEQKEESKPIHDIDLGARLQKKLEILSSALQMSLIMLAEKRETSPRIFVFHITYICPSWKRPSPCFQYVKVVLIRQPSQNIHTSREA